MIYKAIIAYDGTDYAGWQIQPDITTIASTLQKSFYDIFKKEIKVIGASRTDAGVHALGQVIKFETELNISSENIKDVWNAGLPGDILIRSLENVDASFHPQKNVAQKIYWYHFFSQKPLPIIARYGFYYPRMINNEKLKGALNIFQGTHDFRSFCTGDEQESTIRTIDEISLHYFKRFGAYRIEVRGERFLHHMIRRIVGACLEVSAKSNLSIYNLQDVLQQKSPEQTLINAPAQGLMLYKILYK